MSSEPLTSSNDVLMATIGGLLHDIGKLWAQVSGREWRHAHWDCDTPHRPFAECRCRQRFRYAHAPLGANLVAELFGPASPYAELVAQHHATVTDWPLAQYVQRGDHLSAGERDERYDDAAGNEGASEPLLFSPLGSAAHPLRVQPRALADPWPPVQAPPSSGVAVAQAYDALVQRFRAASGNLGPLAGDALVDAVLGLVENTASLVPSAFWNTVPDISLAAHLHHAGAFAGALAARGDPDADPVAVLVMGDLSGIQAFLHRAASARAARQLRARSFYLSLLSLIVARTFARRLGLTPANVLMASGGNFAVLAPPGTDADLARIAAEVNAVLRQTHGPVLDVVVAWTPVTADETRRFGEVMERARQALAVAKLRRHAAAVDAALFAPVGVGGASAACDACGADGASQRGEDEQLCDLCAGLVDLGARLPQSAFLTLEPADAAPTADWRRAFALLGWRVELWDQLPPVTPHRSLVALDTQALAEAPHARLVVAGKYVPTRRVGGQIAVVDFEQLARRGPGRPVLACAKLDVDSLGAFFSAMGHAGRNTPARIASASRFLSLFFEGYIDHQAEARPAQDIYLIYSGGDDAVLVGPWAAVIAFVRALRAAFDRWTGANPDLHFSAGIALGAESRPVILALGEAEDRLVLAKAQPGKDRCTLFGIPFRWDDLAHIDAWEARLTALVQSGALARGLLHTLQGAFEAVDPADPLGRPRYGPPLWRVPYRFRRAAERDRTGSLTAELVGELERELLRPGGAARLAVAARLAEWRTHQDERGIQEQPEGGR
jgi:CRISPR-associated protein Csm1